MFKKQVFWMGLFSIFILGCTKDPDNQALEPSDNTPIYTQGSFDTYVQETRQWLEDNRAFITENKQQEINANTPFEVQPLKSNSPTKGVILVHGLGDSPYSFVDVAPLLAEQGFLVRTILLPGHGSKPTDLLWAKNNNWVEVLAHHTKLLQAEVDEVWLGGFSTGGNLVTSHALDNESIKGLILFSPAYEPRSRLLPLASFASNFLDWVDVDPAKNYVRYDSLTFNAAGEYYKTTKQVKNQLDKKTFDRPVIIAMSEDDSIIDAQKTLELFEDRFTNPDSKFIWYGDDPSSKDSRVVVLNSRIPEQKISNFSHMAALFSPENNYYGKNGKHRICNNGQESTEQQCLTEDDLWYSSFGYVEENKTHARLTWNPYFNHLASEVNKLVN